MIERRRRRISGERSGQENAFSKDSEPVGHHALVIKGHVRRVHPILGQHAIHVGELTGLRDPDPHVPVLARAQGFVERASTSSNSSRLTIGVGEGTTFCRTSHGKIFPDG